MAHKKHPYNRLITTPESVPPQKKPPSWWSKLFDDTDTKRSHLIMVGLICASFSWVGFAGIDAAVQAADDMLPFTMAEVHPGEQRYPGTLNTSTPHTQQ